MSVGGKASPGAKFATSLVLVWTVLGFTWSWRAQAMDEKACRGLKTVEGRMAELVEGLGKPLKDLIERAEDL